ncbi:MAG: HEAT repeat domain-containing protein [Planctomycetes bacterium]|nr:HEAT repeat domain-containing protein [Planctomycetota bacterium]
MNNTHLLRVTLLAFATLAIVAATSLRTNAPPAEAMAPPVAPATTTAHLVGDRGDQGDSDAGCHRQDAAATALGPYAAPTGTWLRFDLAVQASTDMRGGHEERSDHHAQELAGALTVTVVDRIDDEIVVRLQVDAHASEAADAPADDSAATALTRALATGVQVRMRDDGDVLGLRFVGVTTAETRNWVRTLVASLRFVVDPNGAATWTTAEGDATGIARVAYSRIAATEIVKRKQAYKGGEHLRVEGHGTASFAPQVGWLAACEYREVLVLAVAELGAEIRLQLSTSARLREHGVTALADLPTAGWDEPWLSLDGSGEVATSSDAAQRQHMRDAIAGRSAARLVDRIATLLQPTDQDNTAALHEARTHLAWLIELDPDALFAVRNLALTADADLAAVVLSAVGSAGTPAAEALLCELFGGSGLPEALRRTAGVAMFQLRHPGERAFAMTWELASASAPAALRETAMLLHGAFCHAAPELAAGRSLRNLEQHAVRNGEVATWLDAIGNEGCDNNLDIAARYLRHDEPMLRQAAISAIRRMQSPAAVDLLVEATAASQSRSLRCEAAQQLAERGGERADGRVVDLLADPTDEAVRLAVLSGLSFRPRFGVEIEAAVRRLAVSDPAERVRAAASGLRDHIGAR